MQYKNSAALECELFEQEQAAFVKQQNPQQKEWLMNGKNWWIQVVITPNKNSFSATVLQMTRHGWHDGQRMKHKKFVWLVIKKETDNLQNTTVLALYRKWRLSWKTEKTHGKNKSRDIYLWIGLIGLEKLMRESNKKTKMAEGSHQPPDASGMMDLQFIVLKFTKFERNFAPPDILLELQKN